jgi:hypothetical protein
MVVGLLMLVLAMLLETTRLSATASGWGKHEAQGVQGGGQAVEHNRASAQQVQPGMPTITGSTSHVWLTVGRQLPLLEALP